MSAGQSGRQAACGQTKMRSQENRHGRKETLLQVRHGDPLSRLSSLLPVAGTSWGEWVRGCSSYSERRGASLSAGQARTGAGLFRLCPQACQAGVGLSWTSQAQPRGASGAAGRQKVQARAAAEGRHHGKGARRALLFHACVYKYNEASALDCLPTLHQPRSTGGSARVLLGL